MLNIKNKDFTIFKYEELLKAIQTYAIPVYRVIDWHIHKPQYGILIRHDVDRNAANSLEIAKLEHKLNIKTTYYFRKTRGSFKPDIIKEIASMGHEIGYHYEDLSLAKGDYSKAKEFFYTNLGRLKEIAEVKTCAMHGRPFSKHDNRDFWNKYKLEEFDLVAEAFLTIDYSDTYYFTDTGRSWAENSANLRDKVNTIKKANIESTDEMIDFINKNQNQKIALVAHSERWNKTYQGYKISQISDFAVNFAKRVLNAGSLFR